MRRRDTMRLRSSWVLPATFLLIFFSWTAEPQNPAPAEVFPSGVAKAEPTSGSSSQDPKNDQASPPAQSTDSKQANPGQSNPDQKNGGQQSDKQATPDQE